MIENDTTTSRAWNLKKKGEDGDSENFSTVIFYIKRAWLDQSEIQQRRIGSKYKVLVTFKENMVQSKEEGNLLINLFVRYSPIVAVNP